MDDDLRRMWQEINEDHFAGDLKPLTSIDWAAISGEEGIGALGRFYPKSRCIAIDETFRFNREAIRAEDKIEEIKLEVAYRLLMHEMIHQALHEKKAPNPGGHGASFLEEARRIAQQLGEKTPAEEDARHWPLNAPTVRVSAETYRAITGDLPDQSKRDDRGSYALTLDHKTFDRLKTARGPGESDATSSSPVAKGDGGEE